MEKTKSRFVQMLISGVLALGVGPLGVGASEISLGEAVEAPGYTWTTDPNAPWIVQTNVVFSGDSALMAGRESFRAWSVSLSVTGPVTLSFWWRLAGVWKGCFPALFCKTLSSSDFPYGTVAATSCGETNWTQALVYVPAGPTNVTWEFHISFWTSSIDPTNILAFLDNVQVGHGGTAPIFALHPESQQAFPERPLWLRTAVTGTPPFQFQWRIDGTNIDGATQDEVILTNLVAGSTNIVDCVVSNPYGETASEAAIIRVLGGAFDPMIRFTCTPSIGSFLNIHGMASNVVFSDYVVAPYIQAWIGYWNKPYWASPTVPIDERGCFWFDYTTGGIDQTAAIIVVFLIPKEYAPPLAGGTPLPDEIFRHALAYSLIHRVPGLPTLRVLRSSREEIVLGMDNVQPDNWFALETTEDLAANTWVRVPGEKYHAPGVEQVLPIAPGGPARFYRAICVSCP